MSRVVNGVVISADIEAVKEANRRAGHYFFSAASMRFFKCRVHETIYGATYFVTSEYNGIPGYVRQYTVRKLNDDGTISTVDDFQGYTSRYGAHYAARKLARELNS